MWLDEGSESAEGGQSDGGGAVGGREGIAQQKVWYQRERGAFSDLLRSEGVRACGMVVSCVAWPASGEAGQYSTPRLRPVCGHCAVRSACSIPC